MKQQRKPFATAVRFDADRMYVALANGSEVSTPFTAFPRLRDATPQQRLGYVIEERGTGIHWPEIDEDISVAYLLGIPEHVLDELVGL